METTPNEDETYLLLEIIENAIIEAHEQGVEVDVMSSAIKELLSNLSMGRIHEMLCGRT